MRLFLLISLIIILRSFSYGEEVGRKEYSLLIDDKSIDVSSYENGRFLNAVLSVRVHDVDKLCSEITGDDAEYLQVMRKLMEAILSLDATTIGATFWPEPSNQFGADSIEFLRPVFLNRKLEEFKIDKVVLLEDAFSVIVSMPSNKNIRLGYLLRKKSNGEYGWDSEKSEYSKIEQWVSLTLRPRNGEKGKVNLPGRLSFDTETVLTKSPNHKNYVSIKYNSLSLFCGLPKQVKSELSSQALMFLQDSWRAAQYGDLEEMNCFYTSNAVKNINNFYSQMGSDYFHGEQEAWRKSDDCLVYMIISDPLIFAYYKDASPDKVSLIIKTVDGLRFPEYGLEQTDLAQLFQEVFDMEKKMFKKKGSSRQGKSGVSGL